jgi:hypothetical protein
MEKATLQKFIDKYHLAGTIESVIWDSNGSLSCDFVSDAQNLVGNVQLKNNPISDAKVGIYQTSKLNKILTALANDIDVKFDGDTNQKHAISIEDTKNKAKFMLADPSVVKKAPAIKDLPEWDIEIDINNTLISDFVKARNAVPEAENFAVTTSGNKVQFVINYSSINTNRLTFDVDATKITDIQPVAFPADLFKEVLNANRGMTGTLKVSSKGLIQLKFNDNDFETIYYIVMSQLN